MSPRRRRGHTGPPRCRSCQAPITFFGSPHTGARRPFNPVPVDSRTTPGAFPVFGSRAYRLDDLVDVVQVQRESNREDAEAEVRDMPWHTLHTCERDREESTP